ncbi:MAG: hypothetical protein WC764_00575 [Candidatus Paceibacterota bacterium]|jgi:hypothetical protein
MSEEARVGSFTDETQGLIGRRKVVDMSENKLLKEEDKPIIIHTCENSSHEECAEAMKLRRRQWENVSKNSWRIWVAGLVALALSIVFWRYELRFPGLLPQDATTGLFRRIFDCGWLIFCGALATFAYGCCWSLLRYGIVGHKMAFYLSRALPGQCSHGYDQAVRPHQCYEMHMHPYALDPLYKEPHPRWPLALGKEVGFVMITHFTYRVGGFFRSGTSLLEENGVASSWHEVCSWSPAVATIKIYSGDSIAIDLGVLDGARALDNFWKLGFVLKRYGVNIGNLYRLYCDEAKISISHYQDRTILLDALRELASSARIGSPLGDSPHGKAVREKVAELASDERLTYDTRSWLNFALNNRS